MMKEMQKQLVLPCSYFFGYIWLQTMFFLEHPSEATAHLREATSGEVEVLKLFNGLMGR
jgi:hypothetical protein